MSLSDHPLKDAHKIDVGDDTVRCSCGYYDDDLGAEMLEVLASIHAKTNRPAVLRNVETNNIRNYS